MDSHFSPADNLLDINVVWTTTKKTKNKIYVKGTAIGELKLEDHAGITWHISNPESSEEKSLSLYISESAQVYRLKVKYFTASGRLSTWYKGVCTGVLCQNTSSLSL